MIVINDLHIGVKRQAGTTPASQEALRDFVFDTFSELLNAAQGEHVVVLGDLFDRFDVEARDIVRTFDIFRLWLSDESNRLTLVMGNHDASARANKMSGFHLIAHMLCSTSPRVRVVNHSDGLTQVEGGVYAISHQLNQELFNLEIQRAVEMGGDGKILLLHTNFENEFAEHADHSLNVNNEQADALLAAGWKLVFAHEHQGRIARDGRVVVIGNQIPTSVADCLGNDDKFMLKIEGGNIERKPILRVPDVFARLDWRNLSDVATDLRFIRVEGDALADEADQVVDAVAKLRRTHEAFVITNAVRVEGVAGFDALAEMTFDEVSTFNVLEALMEELNPQEAEKVKELLA